MTTNVNPPLNLRPPRRLSGDPESDAFFRQLITILFQLWERTGGGDDTVSDLENDQATNEDFFALFPVIEEVADSLESDESFALIPMLQEVEESIENDQPMVLFEDLPNVKVASSDYTSVGNEIIICTAAITVTLPASPDDMMKVKVKRTEGRVTLSGNGKTVDGDTTKTIIRRYTALNLLYLVETDSWHIL